MRLRYFLLLSVFSGWAALVHGTTCPTDAEYCQATLRVTATCTSSNCVCNPTTLTAVAMGGCADLTVLPTPVLHAGVYSGEVLEGEDLIMSCTHTGYTGAVAYTWQEDGTDVGGQTGATYTKNAAPGDDVAITCKITSGTSIVKTSNSLQYKAYAAGGTITSKTTVAIKGGYTAVATGATFDVECRNRPVVAGTPVVSYTLTPGGSANMDFTVSSFPQADVTCTLSTSGSETLTGTTSDATAISITAFTALTSLSSAITGATSPITIEDTTAHTLTCGVSPATTSTTGLTPTYQWKRATTNLVTTETYNLAGEAVGTHSITCILSLGGTALAESTAVSVTVVADNSEIAAAKPILYPEAPLIGGYMAMRCAVFIKSITVADLTFSWTYDGREMAGQTDHTLQVNAVADSTHGNAKDYVCTASKSLMSQTGTESALTISGTIGTFQPTVVSSKTLTNYVTTKTYTLTCDSGTRYWGALATAAYEWQKDGTTVTGQTGMTYVITPTTTSAAYKCRVKIAGTFSLWTATAHDVLAKTIEHVAILGPSTPIQGQKGVWKCDVTATGTATYVWKKGGSAIADTTELKTITTVAGGDDGSYTCVATVGSETLESAAFSITSIATNPTAPVITGNYNDNHLNKGGSYTLACTTTSDPSQDTTTTPTYAWKGVATGGTLATIAGATSQTYTIASASASWDYQCTVTIGSGTADSTTVTLTVGSTTGNGRYCTTSAGASLWTTICFSDRKKYTGNCIDEHCECNTGYSVAQDDCSDGSGAYLTVASLFTLCLGMLMTRLFG